MKKKSLLLKEKNNRRFRYGMKPRLAEKRDPSQLPQFFHFDHFTGARISPKAKLFLPKIFAIGMIALFPCIVMAIFKLHVLTSAALSVRIVSFKVQSQSIGGVEREEDDHYSNS